MASEAPAAAAAAPATGAATTQLESFSKHTVVVADTGEIEKIKLYKPTDATTNPSLLYKAAQLAEVTTAITHRCLLPASPVGNPPLVVPQHTQYKPLVMDAISYGQANAGDDASDDDKLALILDKLAVNFGLEILKIVPGYVSTEVDARLRYSY